MLSQGWPRNAPYTWVPWKFLGLPGESLTTPTATIPNIFSRAFVPIDPMNVPTKCEVRSLELWRPRSHHWCPGPGPVQRTPTNIGIGLTLISSQSTVWLDWIEQAPTQYRLSGRQFYSLIGEKTQPTASKYWRKSWPATNRKRLQKHQGPPTVLQVNLWKKEKPYHS